MRGATSNRDDSTGALATMEQRAQNQGMLQPGQRVRVNLAGMQVGAVLFHAAVTDAVGTIVKQTSENPSKYLVKLLFSFKGVDEVEVTEERIRA
jgi:hypothetical protein